ncbi:hypothetical protein [Advenella sp. S44]|uniref:hypothetical protein n=1 Tax=Advenella sp. S44 TaxID=1982755 RepID=UPI003510158F
MLDAARSGAGLALLPLRLISVHLQTRELIRALPSTSGPIVPIHVLRIRTRYIQPKVSAMRHSTELASPFQSNPEVTQGFWAG